MGRTQKDNQRIEDLHEPDNQATLKVRDFPGPFVAVRGRPSPEVLLQAAAICAGYSKASRESAVIVLASGPDGQQSLKVEPLLPEEARQLII